MNHSDAFDLVGRLKALSNIDAKIVRILPEDIDPPKLSDDGWDVEFEETEGDHS